MTVQVHREAQLPDSTVKVLDQGYLQLIESWGSDERIIEAARMSTNKGFQGWGEPRSTCVYCGEDKNDIREPCARVESPKHKFFTHGDEKLLKYLYDHKHMTPFEMAGMVIEVKAPIFVFREWHRHRTQSYNEMSARYTPLPDENYMPTVERCLMVSGTNKQAQGNGKELTHEAVITWLENLNAVYFHAQAVYQSGLDIGIPKEIARLPVPVARYSKMRASTCLRNWLAFLTLRMDVTAQWEIRQFANEVGENIKRLYPRTWELFVEGKAA